MAASNSNQPVQNRLSFNQRAKNQALKLLSEIPPDKLQNGIINYKLEDLFYEKVYFTDVTVSFKFVFFKLKKQKVILPLDKYRNQVLTFNKKRAQAVLNQFFANNLSKLTLNEASNQEVPVQNTRYHQKFIYKFFSKATVPIEACMANITHSHLQNSDINNPRLIKHVASPLFKSQRVGFTLSDLKEELPVTKTEADKTFCKVCGKHFKHEAKLLQHNETDIHLFREAYQQCRQTSAKNKNPDQFSGNDIGVMVQGADGNEKHSVLKVTMLFTVEDLAMGRQAVKNIQLVVHYTPTKKNLSTIYLESTFFAHGGVGVILLDNNAPREMLRRDIPIKRHLNFKEDSIGIKEYIVVFKFSKTSLNSENHDPIFVMKKIFVRVDSEATKEDPEETPEPEENEVEYTNIDNYLVHSEKYIDTRPKVIEVATPPPKPKRELKYTRNLKNYSMRLKDAKFFNTGFKVDSPNVLHEKKKILEMLIGGLTKDNYSTFLSLLLHLEEHQMQYDLRSYKMKNVKVSNSSKLVTVKVPGLAENRPSVLKGDAIFMTTCNGPYQGYVHRVLNDELCIGMGSKFMSKFVNNMKVTVDFSFNRTTLKLQHRAVEMLMASKQVPNICFPNTCGVYTQSNPIKKWMNQEVARNPQQRKAVQNIINGTSLPAPYLVFGPPGTGKTVTLVEAINQFYFLSDKNRILATASSNSAADLLAVRMLKNLTPSQVLRLYSPSREWSSVPAMLHKVCNFFSGDVCFPEKNVLMKYRVIVTTLICAGRLVSGGFPMGHFTQIFIDECGHGLEPQALVAVAGLLACEPNPGQLVLSGDPKQLGPVIRSPVAKQLGLEKSLLERLMLSCELYQKKNGHYNPQVLIKLVKNFRTHPYILKVSNELFYENDLEFCGDQGVVYSACEWEELPTKGVPIIFHGSDGKDAQDNSSPSFYNVAEIDLVVQYVKKVLHSKFRGQRLSPADIGIISPYRRQITKLKRALERSCKNVDSLHEMTVGSVEEFQGQERRVIIVSTVRSDPAQLRLDRKFRLGFLRESKRFNVVLTRAKALLIIVGNPHILCTDANWRCLIQWVLNKGAYTGCRFTQNELQACAALETLDPDLRRIPVLDKLKIQLEITREVLTHQDGTNNKWKPGTNVAQSLHNLKSIFVDDEDNISQVETMVFPPFSNLEQ